MSRKTLDNCEKLIDWYWFFGQQRKGRFSISHHWLLKLYECRESAELMCRSSEKKAIAIWGPSQTGKSTLLSFAIDTKTAENSALCWPAGPCARFVASDDIKDTIVLNPYNRKSDASGCVTRFTLKTPSELKNSKYPNEIKLTSSAQVAMALAAGFDNECKTNEVISNFRGKDIQDIAEQLSPASTVTRNRETTKELIHLIGMIDKLSMVTTRFKSLAGHSDWKKKLISMNGLTSDISTVRKLRSQLLWGGSETFNNLYDKLNNWRIKTLQSWGQKQILISTEVAALILDIETYSNLCVLAEESTQFHKSLKDKVLKIGWRIIGDHIEIGLNINDNKLIETIDDFGIFQSLCAEIIIPLNEGIVKKNFLAFHNLMCDTDIIDFPGLPNAEAAADSTRLNPEEIKPEHQYKLLTQVLKRGKTLSIVADAAQKVDFTGMLLLFRSDRFPARPEAMTNIVAKWWCAAKSDYPDLANKAMDYEQKPPLPLYIASTFFAEQINDSIINPRLSMAPAMSMLEKVGFISNPTFSKAFPVTYPHLPGGNITDTDNEKIARMETSLRKDPAYLRLFNHQGASDSLTEIITERNNPQAKGGVTSLLENMQQAIKFADCNQVIKRKVAFNNKELIQLFEEVIPTVSGNEEKKVLLTKVLKLIDKAYNQKKAFSQIANELSIAIRSLLSFPSEDLELIPQLDQREIPSYANQQLKRAMDCTAAKDSAYYSLIGLELEAERCKLLTYLMDGYDMKLFYNWILANTQSTTNLNDRRIMRTFMASFIQNIYLPKSTDIHSDLSPRELRQNVEDSFTRLNSFYNEQERDDANPHHKMVVAPFIDRLKQSLETGTKDRNKLSGDDEITTIFQALSIN